MTMTDPIADMLTRIRNANVAMHEEVRMPSSKQKRRAGQDPPAGGLHRGLRRGPSPTDRPGDVLTITHEVLARARPHHPGSAPGVQARSPGVLQGRSGAARVLGGLGVAVLSTSQGLMTDREARRRRMGGEVLCYVW